MNRLIRMLLALVVAAGLATGTTVANAESGGGITWAPCPEDATAECGTLSLPIDWAKPGGARFDLAVNRRKATDPARRVGVLVINPGGPGASGVDFVLRNRFFSPTLKARFDRVGFDPRGVARSSPVLCPREKMAQAPSSYPANAAEFDWLVAFNRELRQECRAHTGPMIDHTDTLAVVRDVDALRAALGLEKINYYGWSYGTMIGQQYAERYGDRIRAMVVDSVMDHSLEVDRFVETDSRTAEDSLLEWTRWCDRTASCTLHGRDVVKFWDDLLDRADRGEVVDPNTPDRKVPATGISQYAHQYLYAPDWVGLTDYVSSLDSGNPLSAKTPELVDNGYAGHMCEDWRLPMRTYRDYQRLRAIALRAAPHLRGGPLSHMDITTCAGWADDRINNPQHRLTIRNAPQILMLNPLHDPSTSIEWAANAHRQSRDTTTLVVYEGWGHGAYLKTECIRKAADDYLVDLVVPPSGLRCPAVEPVQQGSNGVVTPTPSGRYSE